MLSQVEVVKFPDDIAIVGNDIDRLGEIFPNSA